MSWAGVGILGLDSCGLACPIGADDSNARAQGAGHGNIVQDVVGGARVDVP